MAHYKQRQCRIKNLTSINVFSCIYITKKDTPFSEKWQNVHGNVIHMANLFTSIEDKKLLTQVNYFINHINLRSYQHSKSSEHLRSLRSTGMDQDAKAIVPIFKYAHKLTNKPPVVAATRYK